MGTIDEGAKKSWNTEQTKIKIGLLWDEKETKTKNESICIWSGFWLLFDKIRIKIFLFCPCMQKVRSISMNFLVLGCSIMPPDTTGGFLQKKGTARTARPSTDRLTDNF